MSATVPEASLATVDASAIGSRVELGPADRQGRLQIRLDASKRVVELAVDPRRYAASLASQVVELHRVGTLTIAVVNTVARAQELHAALGRTQSSAELVL